MTNELEQCPFCNGKLVVNQDDDGWWHHSCTEYCYLSAGFPTEAEAIIAANTRYKRACKWKAVCDERFWDTECGMTYECYDAAKPPKFCAECGGAVVLVGGAEVVDA